jgi:hypothetical protein
MMKLWGTCLIIVLVLQAQAASDTIMWSSKPLTPNDFKGRYDTVVYNRSNFATTLWKLTYFYRKDVKTRRLEVIVYAWFDGRRSWMRPTQKKNTALLNHEQGHFDIAEILSRTFRKQVSATVFPDVGYAELLQSMFSELLSKTYELQNKYDVETTLGEVPAKQREWQNYIATTLASLSAYADKSVYSKEK